MFELVEEVDQKAGPQAGRGRHPQAPARPVAVIAQLAILPVFGLQATVSQHLQIGALFTLVSIARGYALRRLFEALRAGA